MSVRHVDLFSPAAVVGSLFLHALLPLFMVDSPSASIASISTVDDVGIVWNWLYTTAVIVRLAMDMIRVESGPYKSLSSYTHFSAVSRVFLYNF